MVLYISEGLKGKSPYEVLQWSRDNNMATTFVQTYKLANLISTIQATAASAERRFSALTRIKIYLRSTRSQDSQLSLLSLEKALVAALKKPLNLHDVVVVVEKFTSVQERNFISTDQNISGKNFIFDFFLL
jgi:hypothetical protein